MLRRWKSPLARTYFFLFPFFPFPSQKAMFSVVHWAVQCASPWPSFQATILNPLATSLPAPPSQSPPPHLRAINHPSSWLLFTIVHIGFSSLCWSLIPAARLQAPWGQNSCLLWIWTSLLLAQLLACGKHSINMVDGTNNYSHKVTDGFSCKARVMLQFCVLERVA